MFKTPHVKQVIRSTIFIPAVGTLVLVAVWVGVLGRLSAERSDVLQAAQAKADVLAEALVQHTETTVHDVDVIALVVKHEFELNPGSVNLKSLQDEGFFTRATAAQVSVVDATGRILQSTIPYAGGVYIADREHFAVHRKPDVGGLYISKPVLGRVSGKWTIQLTRRLQSADGGFGGVVVVSEDRRYLTRGFSDVASLGDGGSASIYLQDGTKLSEDEYGENPNERSAGNNGETVDRARDQITARRPVQGYPLFVEVSLSRSDALTPFNNMKAVYLSSAGILSLFFLMFVAAISVLVHRLSKSRDRLRVLSETDALTGLQNRHGLLALLNDALSKQSTLNQLAIVYIDLGNLKHVNDSLGHEAGDQLLKKISIRLQNGLAPNTVGRFGGDEFLVIVTTGDGDGDVYPTTKRAIDAIVSIFDMAVTLRGNLFSIRASVGISVHARTEDGVTTLIRQADEAMYAAKQQMVNTRKTSWLFYSNEMRESARRAVEAEQRLRNALSEGALQLSFHPIRHQLMDECVEAFRVSVSVVEDDNTLIPVSEFMSLTEENGLLAAVTEFTLLEMCVTILGWQNERSSPVRLTCRLTMEQFLTVDCAFIIGRLMREFGAPRNMLTLEVPEDAFVNEPELAAERAAALVEVGVSLVLCNFSGGFYAFELLESSCFSGVVIDPQSCPADILVSVVDRVAYGGRMVVLDSREISHSVAAGALLSVVDELEVPLDSSVSTKLSSHVANP